MKLFWPDLQNANGGYCFNGNIVLEKEIGDIF